VTRYSENRAFLPRKRRDSGVHFPLYQYFMKEFVTYGINGILPPINEFDASYQPKNNRIDSSPGLSLSRGMTKGIV
jgi:hypothetical protein